jgi:type II secretory pathway pseudopilin PulG
MKQGTQTGQGGASLLEFGIVAAVIAILAGVLLDRLLIYRGESERVAAKQLISSVKTALAVRSAQVISTTGERGLQSLADNNPIGLLTKPPENYLGEYYSPKISTLPKGNWYFDRKDRTLNYITHGLKTFSSGTSTLLRFKVKFIRVPSPVDPNGRNKVTNGLVIDQIPDQPVATTNQAVLFRAHSRRS